MKVLGIRDMKCFFCGACFDVVEEKQKAVFEILKTELKQQSPEGLTDKELFEIFLSKFSTEAEDITFFEHGPAIWARKPSVTIIGGSLGERFNKFAATVRADRGYASH